jgi:peptidoglycan/LPS O-acetylase OafA/YrhL
VRGDDVLDSTSADAVPVAARKATLPRLTSLRAFAALAVFLSHLDIRGGTVGPAGPLVEYGYLGVGFFFVLSGFVLTWSYAPGSGVRAFYLRRFARIWPSHAVMLLVALVAPVTIIDASAAQLLPTAALVQTWVPGVLDPYWLNGVSWSLSCEVAFYLVLPLLLPLMLRRGALLRWGLAVGWWAGAGVITTVVVLTTSGWADAAYTFPPLRFGEFLLGVAAALELRRGRRFSAERSGRSPCSACSAWS